MHIVNTARTWIGTRFHHQGRVKKSEHDPGGCDCLGLIMGVAAELDLKTKHGAPLISLDTLEYGRHPDPNLLVSILNDNLIQLDIIQPGAILLLKHNGIPRHLAIASGKDTIVEANATARVVIERSLAEFEEVQNSYQVAEFYYKNLQNQVY